MDKKIIGWVNIAFAGFLIFASMFMGPVPLLTPSFFLFPLYLLAGIGVLKNFQRLVQISLALIFPMLAYTAFYISKNETAQVHSLYERIELFMSLFVVPWGFDLYFLLIYKDK